MSSPAAADIRFGENDSMRWLEVAQPGSQARLALNPPPDGNHIWVVEAA